MITKEQKRTHYCGEIKDDSLVGKEVVINGWVQNYRDHGDLTFLD